MTRSFALKTSADYLLRAARYLNTHEIGKANTCLRWARHWTNKATELC